MIGFCARRRSAYMTMNYENNHEMRFAAPFSTPQCSPAIGYGQSAMNHEMRLFGMLLHERRCRCA